jgi:hypothetical protein
MLLCWVSFSSYSSYNFLVLMHSSQRLSLPAKFILILHLSPCPHLTKSHHSRPDLFSNQASYSFIDPLLYRKINSTAPAFKQASFIQRLSEQIEQLRGRELPGFMSSQVFSFTVKSHISGRVFRCCLISDDEITPFICTTFQRYYKL